MRVSATGAVARPLLGVRRGAGVAPSRPSVWTRAPRRLKIIWGGESTTFLVRGNHTIIFFCSRYALFLINQAPEYATFYEQGKLGKPALFS